jgi:cell wall-associated NlpC family hydrolase
MSLKGAGLSGIGIALTAGGALLAYSAFRGVTPLEALRGVTSGSVPAIEDKNASLSTSGNLWASVSGLANDAAGMAQPLVQAAMTFRADKYSQAKRWQPGYSDCSSFVGKSLRKIGVAPPGSSTTWDYLASSGWRKIPRSEARAGDLAVNTSHMAIFTSNTNGIGQQNTRRNVQLDTMTHLMSGTGSYTCLRYSAPPKGSSALTKSG